MNVMTAIKTAVEADAPAFPKAVSCDRPRGPVLVDPLADDHPGDDVVVTTRRGISRVALVAVETAGRFQREGVAHDPMTWMLAPRALFGGGAAVDACLGRDACLRGVLLHGLSLGLDADPALMDALADDDDDDDDGGDVEDIDFSGIEFEPDSPALTVGDDAGRGSPCPGHDGEPRLFTATVSAHDGLQVVQAFHASLARHEADIAALLYDRMGAVMSDAVIIEGFDPTVPLVAALVSPAICDMLALIASDPRSSLAAGIDLNVEQRFLA